METLQICCHCSDLLLATAAVAQTPLTIHTSNIIVTSNISGRKGARISFSPLPTRDHAVVLSFCPVHPVAAPRDPHPHSTRAFEVFAVAPCSAAVETHAGCRKQHAASPAGAAPAADEARDSFTPVTAPHSDCCSSCLLPVSVSSSSRHGSSHGSSKHACSRLMVCHQLPCRAVESISGIRPEIQAAIAAAVHKCVTATDLPLPNKRVVSDNSSSKSVFLYPVLGCSQSVGS